MFTGVTVAVLSEGVEAPVQFPDFFSRESGILAPATVDHPDKAAKVLLTSMALGTPGAMVLAVPTPLEHALDGKIIKAVSKLSQPCFLSLVLTYIISRFKLYNFYVHSC